MKLVDLKRRINELTALGESVLNTRQRGEWADYVDTRSFNEFRSSSLSFILSLYGEKWPYYRDFDQHVNDIGTSNVETGIGILKSVSDEINGGWLFTIKGLVSSEIFSDFMDMSEYLLSEGYKDAAAVLIGSVLEEHLRQLCIKFSVPIEIEKNGKIVKLKADSINNSLTSEGVYNKLDQKSVTAWLDLRNKAAHGQYSEYSLDQVKLFHENVLNFMSRNPI